MKILIDENMNTTVLLNFTPTAVMQNEKVIAVDGGGVPVDGGMEGDPGINGENMEGTLKDPLLSSWPVVIGISIATIALGLALGILLAKKRIKKGIVLYED